MRYQIVLPPDLDGTQRMLTFDSDQVREEEVMAMAGGLGFKYKCMIEVRKLVKPGELVPFSRVPA